MATKRKAISKKTRFEVFKRDGFKCMYCGACPPSVLLHVDHVNAVATGGGNDIDNLVTSCEPCNLGKGARSLGVVPQALAEKAAQIAEREEQLQGYAAILEAKRQRLDGEVWRVFQVFMPSVASVPRDEYRTVQRFIEKLGVHLVMESMEIAMASDAKTKNVFRYFCGVCWNRIRELEQ